MNADPLTAAVLVGGRSRRMGTDKALLRLAPGGLTVLETVVHALRQVTDDVVLVGQENSAYAFLDLPWLSDHAPDVGPLAGIQAALLGARADHVLVVACDLPFLQVDLLRFMADRPRGWDALVLRVGQLQPLHAIYARSSLPLIDQYLATGRRQVTGWFPAGRVAVLEQAQVERHDPLLRSCFNLNTPADLDHALQMSQ